MRQFSVPHANTIINFLIADMKERYLGSFFGFFGYIFNPLLLLFIYAVIFSGILKIKFGNSTGMGDFAIYLFCGLIPWTAFSEGLQRSSTVLTDQRNLIKRVHFPKEIFPVYIALSAFFTQFVALSCFLIVLLLSGYELGFPLITLLVVFPFQIIFTMGFSFLLSSMNPFFRDIGVFLGTFLQIWFFCTPIFYPEAIVPDRFLPVLNINPMFHLVRIYRETILQMEFPSLLCFAYFAFVSVLVFVLGFLVFRKLRHRLVDYL